VAGSVSSVMLRGWARSGFAALLGPSPGAATERHDGQPSGGGGCAAMTKLRADGLAV
jgi:hypothetical protein